MSDSKLTQRISLVLAGIAVLGLCLFVIPPKTSEWVMAQETTAGGYAIVAKEYPTLSADSQALIRLHNAKGYLTRQDVSDIILVLTDERPEGIQVYPAPDFGDPYEDTGTTLWRSLIGEPSQYKSKAVLYELITHSI